MRLRGGMLQRQVVVAGDAHQHQAPAEPRHLGGVLHRVVGPGRLDRHIHTTALGCLAHGPQRVDLIVVERHCAQAAG